MTSYIQRQIFATMSAGELERSSGIVNAAYRLKDVLPKYQLIIPDGKWTSGQFTLAGGTNRDIPLPADYNDETKILAIYVIVDLIAQLRVMSGTGGGTSNLMIRGISADEPGFAVFQTGVEYFSANNLNILIPPGAADTTVQYFMYEMPDLNDASSFRGGVEAVGYVTT